MTRVLVRGDGVAGCCAALLLRSTGFQVTLEAVNRSRLPVIMLGDAALHLIRDVFGKPELFKDLPQIRRRIVAWGQDGGVKSISHSAVVVSEEQLLQCIAPAHNDEFAEPHYDWTICSSRPLPTPAADHRFGSRTAFASAVALKPGVKNDACWIESLANGWLFMIPASPGSGWLLSIGETPDQLLAGSRLIAPLIEHVAGRSAEFGAYPRIISPLYGPEWLACGSAAVGFDPICGDGTAYAVREAILAAAVVRGASRGADAAPLLAHYESRMIAGFRRHLELCTRFYQMGRVGAWWDAEIDALERGIRWCTRGLGAGPGFQYQLNGFELEAIA
jgi:flavin-dependent dehydrogenase